MPDKHLDDKFIDQAWKKMRQTLDVEMPEEEKRRRIVFMPWRWGVAASVLLLLSAGLGWWLWEQSTSASPVNIVAQTETKVSSETEDCEELPSIQESTIAANAIEPLSEKELNPGTKSLQTIDKDKKTHIQKNSSIALANNANSVEEKTITTKSSSVPALTSNTVESISITDPISKSEKELITSNSPEKQSLQAIDHLALSSLKYENASSLPKPKPNLKLSSPPIEVDRKSKNWNIGLEFATYSSVTAPVSGFSGGALVEVPVGNDKLNFRTGLNYSNRQNMIDIQPGSTTEALFSGATKDANNVPQFGTSSNVKVAEPDFSLTIHQLNLPAIVEYKFYKFLGLEGGLQASYLMTAQNLKGVDSYQNVLSASNYAQVRSFVNDLTTQANNNGKINIDQFYRWDVMASAGFAVYPIQNLGVRFQYQHGLRDMLKNSQFEAFSNNFRVSAVYFFQ
ncbi:MAG: outer membrane beta-barrel protein [Saprospiraceae bacterium]|nr:outer membrane beta-barrel protein [Saprospiraceae bacterium]